MRSLNPEDEPDAMARAAAPAVWLLDAGVEGVPLTQTFALARAVVREAAERWPEWWDAELFGPPHRELDVRRLGELHAGLKRLKLLRRRGRTLHATLRGRELMGDRGALLRVLLDDLGGGDAFGDMVAEVVVAELAAGAPVEDDRLTALARRRALRDGWRGPDGQPPAEREVSWAVMEILSRGEAYGLIERGTALDMPRRLSRSRVLLSAAAQALLGLAPASSAGMPVFVFKADLVNVRGVSAELVVRADQHLTALHDAIQEAFGWYDDHLYSFWLDGKFWGDDAHEYTTPHAADEALHTADVPLAELDLAAGRTIAYVFDFGDEWRVRLTLRERTEADTGSYPRVLGRTGTAPPQYADGDEE